VSSGGFRQDLFYRLNVVSVEIPPLRERRDDIPLLANYFLNRTAKRFHREVSGLSDAAMEALKNYHFPGNVRELENIIEHAVALTSDDTIQLNDLPPDLREIEIFSFDQSDNDVMTLKTLEQNYIQWVLNRVGRNKTKAARLLGIDRSSLWRHLKGSEFED
jgi:transcriptional regulator with PAS, ATPase and Fis domain